MRPSPGTASRVAMTKWGGRAHWTFDAVALGDDDHGTWLGLKAGTVLVRPGARYVAPVDQVLLVPADGEALERGWVATFHAVGGPVEVYVDVATPPTWQGTDPPVLGAVDLDLDVVRGPHGRTWIDDEDEFAEHRVRLGYPDEVVAAALESVRWLEPRVAARVAPFDAATPAGWLAVLAGSAV